MLPSGVLHMVLVEDGGFIKIRVKDPTLTPLTRAKRNMKQQTCVPVCCVQGTEKSQKMRLSMGSTVGRKKKCLAN